MSEKEMDLAIGNTVGFHRPFSSDLNAMHEAEKVLTSEQRQSVATWICDSQTENGYEMRYWDVYHAAASQRAEAFLRTIGKWK